MNKFVLTAVSIVCGILWGCGSGDFTNRPNGPISFSFRSISGVPINYNVVSDVVIVEGDQLPAPISFANISSAAYSQYSINGGVFTAGSSSDRLYPGDTLQLQQITSSTPNSARTTTITVGGYTTTFTTVTSINGGINTATDANGNAVTITSILASLSAANKVVNYSIIATTRFSSTNMSGISGSTIPVAFTLQAISNTGSVVYSTNASQVLIPFGQETEVLVSGTLPTIASGNLPNAIYGYPITTTNYWFLLISYWQIVPGSLTLQQ
jgi:hypothetical protein